MGELPIYKRIAKPVAIKVGSLMVSPPVTISDKSTIDTAAKVMWEKKVGSVLVVSRAGKILGIVTERDMLFALARSMARKGVIAASIMSKNMISSSPDEAISVAIEKMRQANIRHLPVIDKNGKPMGIVSLRDILDAGVSLVGILVRSE